MREPAGKLALAALLLLAPWPALGAEMPTLTDAAAETTALDAASLKARVGELLTQLDGAGPADIWIVASKLATLGPEAAPMLANEIEKAGDVRKLAIGRALCLAGEASLGGRVLLDLARSAITDEAKIYAARSVALTPELLGLDPVVEALSTLLDREPSTLVRVALADALLRVLKGGGASAFTFGDDLELRGDARAEALAALEVVLEGADRAGAREAALVLGENGLESMAHTRLVELAAEPTIDGRRAFSILTGGRPEWVDLLDEISTRIQESYVDEERVDRTALFDAAAKGMSESLDDFSTYLTVDDVKDMDEMITGSYEGIGAWVGMREGFFTVISPVYEGPAYRAGIRSLDRIVEVDGTPTKEIGFQKAVRRLKGPRGRPVIVKVHRSGWSAPQDFTVVREKITIRSTYRTLLPGDIAYLRLVRFGEDAGPELLAGVEALVADGARALVLDLRDNGGGLLSAAVDVTDVFLAGGPGTDGGLGWVIVYSQGRPGVAPLRRFFSRTDDALDGRPLVVLVNSGTASASEIVSGSLKEWGRARLVGGRTFGKGSVQSLVPLRSTGWATKLRLTIARYYLPTGKSIDKEGIEPHVAVDESSLPAWESEAIVKSGLVAKVEKYVLKSFPANAELFAELADDDGGRLDAYPALREALGELPEHVSENSVRRLARAGVRRRVADRRGKQFVCDLQEDHVLRRGVFELLSQLGDEGRTPPAVKTILDEFAGVAAAPDPEVGHAAAEAPPVRQWTP